MPSATNAAFERISSLCFRQELDRLCLIFLYLLTVLGTGEHKPWATALAFTLRKFFDLDRETCPSQ
jgi:hypothetical protein